MQQESALVSSPATSERGIFELTSWRSALYGMV
jgi:hypothetical protein